MSRNKWIKLFEEMDINAPPPLDIKVFKGEIGRDFVQENYNVCIQLMHGLKKKIGFLTDTAKLRYLIDLKLPEPKMPDFGSSNPDHIIMGQAFYQSEMYYYEFVNDYMAYLKSRIQLQKTNNMYKDSELSALDLLEWDIDFALKKINEQVSQKISKTFFIVSNREIIDVNSFKNFIEANELINLGRTKDLIRKAKRIIDLYNDWLYGGSELAKNESENVSIKTPKGGFLSINVPFECIWINNIDTPSYATSSGYEDFFDNHPKSYSNYQFALRCLHFIKAVDNGFSEKISIKNILKREISTQPFDEKKAIVYFSYAWSEASEILVNKLYESLKGDGFNVSIDKNDIDYNQRISQFMETIGQGNFVIIALSDKYLRSDNCMYEFSELYRNSKLDANELQKKIYPIRVERLNLNDPSVIESYLSYWANRESQFRNLVNKFSYSQQHHRRIEAIANYIRDLLPILSDINTATTKILSERNFAIIKEDLINKMNLKTL